MSKLFVKGTLAEFNTWHDNIKNQETIPAEGKVNCVNGIPAPKNQRTFEYAIPKKEGKDLDNYIWCVGKYPINGKSTFTIIDYEEFGTIK